MPAVGINWTADKIDYLRQQWAAGASCTEIGKAMSCSRSAIIGKVHRLKLDRRGPSRLTDEQREERRKQRNSARVIRARKVRNSGHGYERGERKVQQPRPIVAAPSFIGSLNIPFGDLRRHSSSEPNQCRFIADEPPGPEYRACGNETLPGESWCGHCKDVVFKRQYTTTEENLEQLRANATVHFRKSNSTLNKIIGLEASF